MNITVFIVVGLLVASLVTISIHYHRSIVFRIAASVIAFGFSAFCAFGYLASFELSPSPVSLWHLGYGLLGIGSLAAGLFGAGSVWKDMRPRELANG